MKKTFASDSFVVYDDVLDEESWSEVWTYFQFEDLAPTTRTDGAWKWEDGQALAGPDFHAPSPEVAPDDARLAHIDEGGMYPTEAPGDHVLDAVLGLLPELTPIRDPWLHIAARAYVYPVGAALSWHRDDHDQYAGAFVYYAHPEWNVQWGGELLIAQMRDPMSLPMMPYRFENRDYSATLMEEGLGQYILPRPNRLIVLGNQPHRVTPVLPAAGNRVRASVAGFFVREQADAQDDDA